MKYRNIFVAGFALACAYTYWDHTRDNVSPNSQAAVTPPTEVVVADVVQSDVPITVSAVGRTEAKVSVAIKSRMDGQVAEAAFTEGQPVKRGQLLVRIDPAVLETQQRQAEGLLARDQALLAKYTADHKRNLSLVDQGFISQSALGQSTADLNTAEANMKADRANLENARLQLGYTRIVAPIDGVAGALMVPVGGAVKANDTPLLTINQTKPIYVTFSLPEAQLPRLKLALAHDAVTVSATVMGLPKAVVGKLAFIDNSIDPASGAITVKAVFPNSDGLLTPGQFAQVDVAVEKVANALVVPVEAVESGLDGSYVFVVNADSTVAIRKLTVSAGTAKLDVVTSGLKSGERVVVSGQAGLRDKAKVKVSTASSAAL